MKIRITLGDDSYVELNKSSDGNTTMAVRKSGDRVDLILDTGAIMAIRDALMNIA
jgi:predicted aspartyl protease